MTATAYPAQFVAIDFRLLDNPEFGAFMRSPAFAVYMILRRHVWRSRTHKHPLEKVNQLFEQGHLACAVPRSDLARKVGLLECGQISHHLSELISLGVVEKVRTGRQNIHVIGTWAEHGFSTNGSTHGGNVRETFLLEKRFGKGWDLATSDVAHGDRSDVAISPHSNKEKNKKKKSIAFSMSRDPDLSRDRPFEPVDRKERFDDVLYVED